MPEDRIAQLSKRFRTHGIGRKSVNSRSRERHSLYLDIELIAQLDQAYKALNHTLYPRSLSKSVFLETLIEYGLQHLPEITAALPHNEEAAT
jgi:hypothetical protein